MPLYLYKKMRVEPKFNSGDYIINRSSGDIGVIDKVTPRNYYHFKAYYSAMFDELKDVTNKLYDLQVDYQKFFDLCTEEEIDKMNKMLKR